MRSPRSTQVRGPTTTYIFGFRVRIPLHGSLDASHTIFRQPIALPLPSPYGTRSRSILPSGSVHSHATRTIPPTIPANHPMFGRLAPRWSMNFASVSTDKVVFSHQPL